MVTCNPVDFLGHLFVEGAQTGFDVDHRDMQLGSSKRPGQCGIGIPVNHHAIRLFFEDYFLDPPNHLAGLRTVTCRTDLQVIFWLGNLHLPEENFRHGIVVMLPGVQNHFSHLLFKSTFNGPA